MKTCCTCKVEKAIEEFGRNIRSHDGLQKRCKECSRAASSAYYYANKERATAAVKSWAERNPERRKKATNAWRASNPDKLRAYRRKANLKGLYGLTEEQFDALASQGCAICGVRDGPEHRLHVDHDHTCCPGSKSCGKCVRGLLCRSCNQGLGNFKDAPSLLREAILYLEARH